ncbi:hypothetical protein B0H67DRAFT_562707 [Lasiosphaeris hirsuta]|uniref:Uncharacterized protein n=1 Tax=Lasiosphaeris hirsuta TaxID=260670 RepID=A0AA40BB28_9PEZI|nr:hypothetical protein B0H67DRAFT_562707 [Lasiosphaeris hirsuta]
MQARHNLPCGAPPLPNVEEALRLPWNGVAELSTHPQAHFICSRSYKDISHVPRMHDLHLASATVPRPPSRFPNTHFKPRTKTLKKMGASSNPILYPPGKPIFCPRWVPIAALVFAWTCIGFALGQLSIGPPAALWMVVSTLPGVIFIQVRVSALVVCVFDVLSC